MRDAVKVLLKQTLIKQLVGSLKTNTKKILTVYGNHGNAMILRLYAIFATNVLQDSDKAHEILYERAKKSFLVNIKAVEVDSFLDWKLKIAIAVS